MSLKTN